VNLDALPYTVLLILVEFTVGSLVATLVAAARGMVTASFVKLSAVLIVAGAALALLAAFGTSGDQFEGYRVDEALFGPARGVLVALLALSIAYAALVLSGRRPLAMVVGAATAIVGVAALGVLAYQISAPAWGFAGVFLSLLVGALALGFVSEAMVLGHWYLVQPKLPGRPLEELTFALLAVLAVQAVLVIVNAAVPARHVPDTAAVLAGSLASNPAFWLRIGVGLLFPIVLAFMAWRSSTERSMMSATGLLYIAVGAVFVGELLARGLLFVTASPV
jgi:hypothetical protein